MPAAAVIPAPIAYINVVAVKKLVVGFWASLASPIFLSYLFFFLFYLFGGREEGERDHKRRDGCLLV